jgi:hypothetical protein
MGCEVEIPEPSAASPGRKCLKWLTFCRSATRGSNLAGRQGVSAQTSRNVNKDRPFQRNAHKASELACSDSFVRLRPFASVAGFAGAMSLEMSLAANVS